MATCSWWVDQVAMAGVVAVLGVAVTLCELVRVVLHGAWHALCGLVPGAATQKPRLPGGPSSGYQMTVLVDGECAVCSALRIFVAYRLRSSSRSLVRFAPAQRVADGLDSEAQRLAAIIRQHTKTPGSSLGATLDARLHAVIEARSDKTTVTTSHDATVLVGADVIFALAEACHAPYSALACIGRCAPRVATTAAYDVFARNRRAWFPPRSGRSSSSPSRLRTTPTTTTPSAAAPPGRDKPLSTTTHEGDSSFGEAAQCRQVSAEGVGFSAVAVAAFVMVALPLGDGKKDGPTQFAARCACAALIFFAAQYLADRAAEDDTEKTTKLHSAVAIGDDLPKQQQQASSAVPPSSSPGGGSETTAPPTTTTPKRAVVASPASKAFEDRYVGRASAESLAVMRVVAAFILYLFTLPFFTAPLAETALAPRFMCKPTGVVRLLGVLAPSVFGPDALLADADGLATLQHTTRALLVSVGVGFATPLVAPAAAACWLVYGGVLRSYNTWRGHSFIAAWWTLVVLAWRGGAGERFSVDAWLFHSSKKSKQVPTAELRRRQAQDRGWTRFMVTLVFANNYFMAGLSKFCASGVAWAFGSNLKAKLLQTSLTQGSFGVYLSLGLRHLPSVFWGLLGFCGLYGELAMGLVPFDAVAKLAFPTAMWGMHLGIIALQHIVFVDLLTMIPSWYAWHAVDLVLSPREDRGLYVDGPWDWRRVASEARAAVARWSPLPSRRHHAGHHKGKRLLRAGDDDDDEAGGQQQRVPLVKKSLLLQDAGAVDAEAGGTVPADEVLQQQEHRHALHNARRAAGLVFVFVFVWLQGAEWYPWNSFRMFADWTANPIDYERYVALDAERRHLRNFHMHQLNPVLNRKRFVDALETCATDAASADCAAFLAFAQPQARAMPDTPAYLVLENRVWDYERDIDRKNYCDEMTVYEYDVQANRVVRKDHVTPCDPIDWKTCCTRTIGTI